MTTPIVGAAPGGGGAAAGGGGGGCGGVWRPPLAMGAGVSGRGDARLATVARRPTPRRGSMVPAVTLLLLAWWWPPLPRLHGGRCGVVVWQCCNCRKPTTRCAKAELRLRVADRCALRSSSRSDADAAAGVAAAAALHRWLRGGGGVGTRWRLTFTLRRERESATSQSPGSARDVGVVARRWVGCSVPAAAF